MNIQDFSYKLRTETRLEIDVPERNLSIFVTGKMSSEGDYFYAKKEGIDNAQGLTPSEKEEIKGFITRNSNLANGPTIIFE